MSDHLNETIEKIITKERAKQYNLFKNIQEICRGPFGIVRKATWGDKTVVLKSLNNDTNEIYINAFINELQNLIKVDGHDHLNIIQFYGVTRDPNQYNLILQFAVDGNLREYLKNNFPKLEWTDKLRFAQEIAEGLMFLHNQGILHRDLHSKNILVHHQRMIIADFGISKHIDEVTMVKAGGMFAYLEPRCFADPKYKCDKRSDIYSFGVILWEISSGRPPFDSYEHKIAIVMQVNSGVREIPVKNTPDIYVDLYKRCWDQDPGKRPKIMEVLEDLKTIRFSKSMNSRSFIRSFKSLESIRPFKSIKLNKFTVSMDNLFRSPTHEGTSQSNEETSQSSEDAPQSNEVTSQSSEDASQSNEDTSEETSQSNEENANNTIGIRSLKLKLENKRFILSIKNIFPPSTDDAGKSSQLNNEIFQSKEVPFQSNAEPFQSNEEPFNPNEEPFQSNNEPFQLNGDTSTIITNEHIKEIISWINPSPHNTLHELKLILRGSRDGFEKSTFYNKCKNIDNTIIILKVLETKEIVGGYNPLTWKVVSGKKYKVTGSSFIFSLKTNEQSSSTLSKVKNKDFAICCLKGIGPSFGELDLFVSGSNLKTWKCCRSNYEEAIKIIKSETQSREFQIEDYEVFKYE